MGLKIPSSEELEAEFRSSVIELRTDIESWFNNNRDRSIEEKRRFLQQNLFEKSEVIDPLVYELEKGTSHSYTSAFCMKKAGEQMRAKYNNGRYSSQGTQHIDEEYKKFAEYRMQESKIRAEKMRERAEEMEAQQKEKEQALSEGAEAIYSSESQAWNESDSRAQTQQRTR